MIINAMAHDLNDGDLFKPTAVGNQNIFEIPEYQRPYVWNRNNWEALFDDITGNDPGYFVGAIICAQKDTTPDYTEFDVIDGQQRLTTLSIFMVAIYDAIKTRTDQLLDVMNAKDFNNFWNGDRSTKLFQIKCSLLVKTANGKFKPRIIPQNQNNIDDYFNILFDAGLITKNDLAYDGSIGNRNRLRLISKAYEYFQKRVSDYAVVAKSNSPAQQEDLLQQQVDRIIEILDKLNVAQLVMIKAPSTSSANTLFEALNNRGEPLTITDLIKNKLFSKLKSTSPQNFQQFVDEWNKCIWQKIFFINGKEISAGEQERFFRQNYNAFRSYWNTGQITFPIGKRSNLYESYGTMIDLDPQSVFERIKESAETYLKLQGRYQGNLSQDLFEAYKDLDRISGATSYTLLLYLVKNKGALNLSDNDFVKICRVLIKLFVRRSLTGDPPANKMDSIFIDYIGKIESNHYTGGDIAKNLAAHLKKEYGSDDKFEIALRDDVYDDKGANFAIRFILVKIAEKYLGKQKPNFWLATKVKGKGKGTSTSTWNWTIEHVLPQTLNQGWIDMLGSNAAQIQEDNVHKLGNLTLTPYNSNLSNGSFSDKKSDPNFGYNNSILAKGLNSYICAQTEWGEKQIQERTDLLIKEILAIFAW